MTIQTTKKLNKADLTILPLLAEDKLVLKLKKLGLDREVIKLALEDFKNTAGALHLFYVGHLGRVLLLGLGNKKDLSPGVARNLMQTAILAAKKYKIKNLQIDLRDIKLLQRKEFLESISFGVVFAQYAFSHYRQEKSTDSVVETVQLVIKSVSKQASEAVRRGQIIAQAANNARDLSNHPANVATPSHLAAYAKNLSKKYNMRIKILETRDMEREKMGLLLGVSKGSEQPPKFIVLEYLPALPTGQAGGRQAAPKESSPIVLIGKGLTFDSGGISIKPSDRMEEMKYDMSGGATVLGILEAAAALKLRLPLVGLIPSSENLLSGRATKPGDILTSMSGKTVEVINTDAEGRLILADAITYAQKYYHPQLIMDFATLTMAIVIALGDELTGVFANTQKFSSLLKQTSGQTAEKLWSMPLPEEYKDQLKSQIADIKNVGEKNLAGAVTAALFLQTFIKDVPWIHLDIAGTAWTMRPRPDMPVGATGWGVYLTIRFLAMLSTSS